MQVLLLEPNNSGKAREVIYVGSIEEKNIVNQKKNQGWDQYEINPQKRIEPYFLP